MTYGKLIAFLRMDGELADMRGQAADAIATLQAEVERLTRERDEAIGFVEGAKAATREAVELARELDALEARVKELETERDKWKQDAIRLAVDKTRLRLAAKKAVEEMELAAIDLTTYARHEYGFPDIHPALKAKFDRDMSEVEKLRSARAELMEAMEGKT